MSGITPSIAVMFLVQRFQAIDYYIHNLIKYQPDEISDWYRYTKSSISFEFYPFLAAAASSG